MSRNTKRGRRNPSGEWWIDSDGSVEFADGDIGAMGHEAVVADKLTRQFLDHIESGAQHDESVGTLADHEEDVVAFLAGKGMSEEDAKDDPINELYKMLKKQRAAGEGGYLLNRTLKDDDQFDDAFWIAATGPSGQRDARVYAMKYDGWKRVQGNSVETWRLTQADLKAIADGLAEIYQQDGVDEIPPDDEFYIEVRASKKYYTSVPWSAIDGGDLGEVTRGHATNPRRRNPRVSLRAMPRLSPAARRQLARGTRVEMEHTSDRKAARLIAAQHLAESPRYYAALAKMEKGLKRNPTDSALLRSLEFHADTGAYPEGEAVFTATLGRKVVGTLQIIDPSKAPEDSELFEATGGMDGPMALMVFVDKDYRRRGVAQALYDAAKAYFGEPIKESPDQTKEGSALRRGMRPNPPIPYEAPNLAGMRVLTGFRPARQLHHHTCGPACLRAVLAWNSIEVTEAALAKQANTTKKHGTKPEDMVLTLQDYGRRARLCLNADVNWCLQQLRRDCPVIILWNDWHGHWVVLIGYDPKTKRLLFADPANPKNGLRVHSLDTLRRNWTVKVAGTKYKRLAISVA